MIVRGYTWPRWSVDGCMRPFWQYSSLLASPADDWKTLQTGYHLYQLLQDGLLINSIMDLNSFHDVIHTERKSNKMRGGRVRTIWSMNHTGCYPTTTVSTVVSTARWMYAIYNQQQVISYASLAPIPWLPENFGEYISHLRWVPKVWVDQAWTAWSRHTMYIVDKLMIQRW